MTSSRVPVPPNRYRSSSCRVPDSCGSGRWRWCDFASDPPPPRNGCAFPARARSEVPVDARLARGIGKAGFRETCSAARSRPRTLPAAAFPRLELGCKAPPRTHCLVQSSRYPADSRVQCPMSSVKLTALDSGPPSYSPIFAFFGRLADRHRIDRQHFQLHTAIRANDDLARFDRSCSNSAPHSGHSTLVFPFLPSVRFRIRLRDRPIGSIDVCVRGCRSAQHLQQQRLMRV